MQYSRWKTPISFILLSLFLLAACKTTSKKGSLDDILSTQRSIQPADSMIQKQRSGIDIFAAGNKPVDWTLEVDFDSKIIFTANDGNQLNLLPAFEKKEITDNLETYSQRSDLGMVVIKVFNEACGENKKVEVSIQNKIYNGCGQYLYDHQLNDIWELESIDQVPQPAAGFSKGLPTMSFNLPDNKMTGSDGCNNINSGIEVKGTRIKFTAFSGTKMTCGNNKAEKIFAEKISNKLVNYYLENGKLIFYLEDDSKIAFKRKAL